VLAWRGAKARPAVIRALDQALGADWRDRVEPERLVHLNHGPRWGKVLFAPLVRRGRDVERIANIRYGEAGRANTLDLYRHRNRPASAPVLVYFHGGGYYSGNKSRESRALLFRLARQGWVTISANYRLRPGATFFDHLADVKRVVAWVHEHGPTYGADPAMLVLAGGSAGGHLASIAALTQNEPRLQPGFEDADTSVSAVIGLYGWYGGYYGMGGADSAVGPLGYDASKAPPFFVAHGALDTLAMVETARRFVHHLRSGSSNPVVYAELPGGHHAFDVFYSLRYEAVVDGVEAITAWLRTR
jgi:acetyl esterase/lipase